MHFALLRRTSSPIKPTSASAEHQHSDLKSNLSRIWDRGPKRSIDLMAKQLLNFKQQRKLLSGAFRGV